VSGSSISWAIYKSAPRSRQITTPAPHHSVFYRPDALPAAKPTASKHWRQLTLKGKLTWLLVAFRSLKQKLKSIFELKLHKNVFTLNEQKLEIYNCHELKWTKIKQKQVNQRRTERLRHTLAASVLLPSWWVLVFVVVVVVVVKSVTPLQSMSVVCCLAGESS